MRCAVPLRPYGLGFPYHCRRPAKWGGWCLRSRNRAFSSRFTANAPKTSRAVRLRSTGDKPRFIALQSLTKSLCALFPCRAWFLSLRFTACFSVVKEHRRSFRSALGGCRTCDTHGNQCKQITPPPTERPFFGHFSTFAPIFHAWELAFLGVARRIRHLPCME